MPELYTCNTPQYVDPGATVFRVAGLMLDWAGARIAVYLQEWTGSAFGSKRFTVEYIGSTATNMMIALNKANLSSQSLNQRVINRLIADGYLPAGSLGGTVD